MTLERITFLTMGTFGALAFAMAILLASTPLADAGVFGTPTGGWGIDRPAPPAPDGFLTGGASGRENL